MSKSGQNSNSIVLGCRGMVVDPNQLTTAPTGAMKVADNVIVRRDNTIEPRFGLHTVVGVAFAWDADQRVTSLMEWEYPGSETVVGVARRTGSFSYEAKYQDGTVITGLGQSANSGPLDETIDYNRSVVARKNLYVTSDAGLCRLSTPTDTVFLKTPSETPEITVLPVGGLVAGIWLIANACVNYAALLKTKDANDYEFRNVPSPTYRYLNTVSPAETVMPKVVVNLPYHAKAGDVVEIYSSFVAIEASPGVDAPAGDELFLIKEITLVAADITAKTVTYFDARENYLDPDAPLGAALYTNAGAQGINAAAFPSSPCSDVANFKECTWIANTKSRATFVSPLLATNQIQLLTTNRGARRQWFGFKTSACITNVVLGTTAVTIAQGVGEDILPGQVLTITGTVPGAADAVFAANTTVTSYNPVTGGVVFSPAAVGPIAAPFDLNFSDVFTVNTTSFYASDALANNAAYDTTNRTVACRGLRATANAVESAEDLVASSLAGLISSVMQTSDKIVATAFPIPNSISSELHITSAEGTASVEVSCTSWLAFTKIPDWSAVDNSVIVDVEEHPNRVYYSKPSEPEAYPLLNYIDVGDSTHKVLRIIGVTDGLIVIKQEGIWRISGDAPDSWRLDCITTDYYGMCARLVSKLDDTIYVWTNKGIVSSTQYGQLTNLTDVPFGTYARGMTTTINDAVTEPQIRVLHSFTHDKFRLVCFQGPAFKADESTGTTASVWCYSPITEAWTTWNMRADGTTCALFVNDDQKLLVARNNDSPEVRQERTNTDERDSDRIYDMTYVINIATVDATGLIVTITAGTQFEPQTGDRIDQGGISYIVRSVSGANITMNAVGIVAGAATGVEAIRIICKWLPMVPGSPNMGALWRDMGVHLQDMSSELTTLELTSGAVNETISNALPEIVRSTQATNNIQARTWRTFMPRNVVRANKISPYIEMSLYKTYLIINGVTLVYAGTGERVNRGFGT